MESNQNMRTEKSSKVEIAENSTCSEEQIEETRKLPDPYIDRSVGIQHGMYGKWIFDKKEDDFVFNYIGAAVYLQKTIVYAESLNRELDLLFYDPKGEKVTFSLPREKMTEQHISEFTQKGIQVQKKNMATLLMSIFNQEKEAPVEIRHKKLGFSEYNHQKVFFGAKGVGINSIYAGSLAVVPTGSFEIWKKMIREEVLGTDMELILAIASAAPLIDFFHETLHTGNLLVSLVGESSTGKTTAGCLAVSLGARCNFGDGMMLTFADSKNSIMNGLCSAYPTVIDEGSLIRFNPTSLLYELAEGREKGRLTRELVRAESNTFNTAIFMTTEKSILGLCDQNTGLLVRCFEFEGIIWTRSADSADRIKAVSERNYGFVIIHIATLLLKIEKANQISEVLDKYKEYQKKFVTRLKEKGKYTPLSERICKSVAIIALGAEFFTKATGIPIDPLETGEKVLEYTAVSDIERLDIGCRALDYLSQYVTVNYSHFVLGAPIDPDDPSLPEYEQVNVPRDCKGRITSFPAKRIKNGDFVSVEVFLSELVFDDVLLKGGFQDKKVILKKWKESGVLHCDNDRYKSTFEIVRKQPVKGYRIFLPASLNDARRAESAERKKKEVLASANASETVQMEQKTRLRSVSKNKPSSIDKTEKVQSHKILPLMEDEDKFLAD